MTEQEMLDKMHQHEIESEYSNSWYPVGVLEWTDDIPNYAECSTTGDDWLTYKIATQIDKKDTLDIAHSIAENIYIANVVSNGADNRIGVVKLRDIIQEGLNAWITVCETEDTEYRNYQNDLINEQL